MPFPNLVLDLPVTAGGTVGLTTTWPAGLPGGFDLYFQYWVNDAAAPLHFASSNGITVKTP